MDVARRVARPVGLLTAVLRPLVAVLLKAADLQAPGRGVASPVGVSEAELRKLAVEAAAAGSIEPTDLELMERAFAAGDEIVGAIVVPRREVVAVPDGAGLRKALDLALEHGHRRLPVTGTDLDDVVGMVLLRDLARAVADDSGTPVRDMVAPVLVVPESRRVLDVLRDMQGSGRHLAVVVDEHGGTAGIVTIEDVIEEVVGDIDADRLDAPMIAEIEAGRRWSVAGAAPVDDLAEALGVDLPEGDWHTAAGLVLAMAGRIPTPGDRVSVSGHRIRVVSATRRRIRQLEITREDGS
jgi:CBS domain containing-hemolysin-like protein